MAGSRSRSPVLASRTMDRRQHLAPALSAALLLGFAQAALGLPRLPSVAAGLDADLASAAAALSAFPSGATEDPPGLVLRVVVPWEEIEIADGLFEWDRLDALIGAAKGRRVRLVLTLTGPGPAAAGVPVEDEESLARWLAFVTEVTTRARGRILGVSAWEHADDPSSWGRPPSPRDYAFLLKRTALAVQAVAPGALVVQGAVADPAYQTQLFSEGVAPFVDAYALTDGPSLGALLEAVRAGDPGADTWVVARDPGEDGLWEACLAALEEGQELTTFTWIAGRTDVGRAAAALAALDRAFPADTARTSTRMLRFPDGSGVRAVEHAVASDLSSRIVYRGPAGSAGTTVDAVVPTADVRAFRIVDPQGEHEGRVRRVLHSHERDTTSVRLPLADRSLVLAFEPVDEPGELAEEMRVAGGELLSVAEIVARHLKVQAARDRLLRHYTADLTTEMRYDVASAGRSVTVRIESRYYSDPAGTTEIENLRYFINGAPYNPKKGPPEIPLIQPEKVTVAPLEVHLDKSYEYVLAGRDTVGGRPAYEVRFRSLEEDTPTQDGTVWIDAETFDRLRVRTVQRNLEAPILSNAQVDTFVPVVDEDGGEHRLVGSSAIERTFSILGASVVVRMDLTFEGFAVNTEAFAQELEQARESPHQMLRDTDEGFRYLRRQEDGSRVLADARTRRTLLLGGARVDPSFELEVVPLAGVNWIDHDFGGDGRQLNLFLAGAINVIAYADPSLWGSRLEGSLDAVLPAVGSRDRLRFPERGYEEVTAVSAISPDVDLALGIPVGKFGKMEIAGELEYAFWDETDDTDPSFVLPADGFVATLGVTGEIHRKGWDMAAWASRSWRDGWEAWGSPGRDGEPGTLGETPDAFWRWGGRLAGSWRVGRGRTIKTQLHYQSGDELDRFSQYEFSAFGGASVQGFSGSGIHFDESLVLKTSYGIDLFGVFGLDLSASYGIVRDRLRDELAVAAFGRESDALGVGVSGSFPGPWGTILQLDLEHAVHSDDFDDVEGNLVVQLLFFKLLR